jgi:hypothetical protein
LFITRSFFWAIAALLFGLLASAPAGAQSLVALGDSFSSGQGAPPYELGTAGRGNTCYRSDQAWPMLLAEQLHSTR